MQNTPPKDEGLYAGMGLEKTGRRLIGLSFQALATGAGLGRLLHPGKVFSVVKRGAVC
jgi:hypothetical protein